MIKNRKPVMKTATRKASHPRASRNGRYHSSFALYETENSLPKSARAELVVLLNQHLADAIDLQMQLKQAHWNVKGPNFIGLHELFDKVAESVESYVDLVAERITQLGGIAQGTIRAAATNTRLPEYPPTLANGSDHIAAVATALSTFGDALQAALNETMALNDPNTTDMLTEISRGIDQWLWFVEAHAQATR